MTRLPLFVLPGLLVAALAAPPASAQEPAPPAHVAYVDGRAVLERDTTSEDVEPNVPLDTGDRLRTERGRVEVLFGDGSILQLDEDTTIDVLSDSLVRELGGRLAIIAGNARAGRLQVDTPAGSVRIMTGGEFRVSVFDEGGAPVVEVAVIRGSADLFTDHGSVSIGAGARAVARQGEAPSQPMSFNSAQWDAFDRWSQDRLSLRRGAASYRYVPPTLRPYGAVLDAYGSWNYEPAYGYVWFPHVVSGWRPYYHGRWRFYPRFGWTWVGGDVWGWPTHHYGRWGTTSAGAWFWVPGRTWGPAWVHWAVSPGYVSWCALGFDGRPVVPFGYGYASRPYYRHDPWAAWTVVRRDHFGRSGPVTGVAVDGRRFGPEGVRPFVVQATPPNRPYAVARAGGGSVARAGAAPPGGTPGAGGVAVSRASAERAGQAAASDDWGRDMRWTTPGGANRPAAVRRGADAPTPDASAVAPSWRRSDRAPAPESASAGHYGVAVPRGDPASTPPAGAAVPRASARRWSSDSVPVYRGGRTAPLPTPPDGPRAVPRGASPTYAPVPGAQPPAYQPRTYPSRSYEPGTSAVPAGQPPVYTRPTPGYGAGSARPRSSETPSPSSGAPPAAAPRQAPDRGSVGVAAPRSGGESRGESGGRAGSRGGNAAAGAHPSRRR
jgi:hypothetical protein